MRAGVVDSLLLPAPTEVASSLWNDRGLLGPDLAVTLPGGADRAAAAVAVGAALGVGMHVSPAVRGARCARS